MSTSMYLYSFFFVYAHFSFALASCSSEPAACVVSGCSNEICSDEVLLSTCVFDPVLTCLEKFADCSRDEQGKCGWKKRADYDLQCMEYVKTLGESM